MTKRGLDYATAAMLRHLTGGLLLSREPYAVNIPAIIEAAAATKTLIEINASPFRLDMDWRWWPLAKEKGVRCVINPDAHSTAGLQDLVFGINAARKGWLTRGDVVNTLPLGKIESVLASKRELALARHHWFIRTAQMCAAQIGAIGKFRSTFEFRHFLC